jgi:outer membrane protein
MRLRFFVSIVLIIIFLAPAFGNGLPNSASSKGVVRREVFNHTVPNSTKSITVPSPITAADGIKTPTSLEKFTLEDSLNLALERNQRRIVSQYAVQIAEYQHRQALSAYWPTLALNLAYNRLDENPNFILPQESAQYRVDDFTPEPIYPRITIPQKEIKVMDRDTGAASLDMTYPLFTGGVRSSITEQARYGVEAAKEAARRADLDVIYDVKRMYYGLVLAQQLLQIGQESLARMDSTLQLTENFYQNGSGRVAKTDYLRNKVIVEGFRSILALLEKNRGSAKAALINTIGLPWNTEIEISETLIPFLPRNADLSQLIGDSYEFNPDWNQMEKALQAANAKIREEKGQRLPQAAIAGSLSTWNNSYDAGLATSENKEGWRIGVVVQIPLFNGFLTTNKIKAAIARLEQLRSQQVLFKEGLALNIKNIFLSLQAYQKQESSFREAFRTAQENRELNERAYQQELVDTKDVIESQLLESFMNAQYKKALYDCAESHFQLDMSVGKQIQTLIENEENQ